MTARTPSGPSALLLHGALAVALLLAASQPASAQQDGWDLVLGIRGGAYVPAATVLRRTHDLGSVEGEAGYSPQASVEVGLATGSPATILRLMVGYAPSLDLDLWRRPCGRGSACSLGTAEGGVATVTGEIVSPFTSPLQEWDMAFLAGVGVKRYGWSMSEAECATAGGQPVECEDALALARPRSVFTVHLGVEALYPLGRHSLVVQVSDYLSGSGVRTSGAAQGQFQNDLVFALGLRVRRPF